MRLLIIILNKVEKLEEILEGFLEIGITGATVIESTGMGQILSEEVPIFAGLRFMFSGARPHNKTILSVIKEEKEEQAINLLKQVLGDLGQTGTGIAWTIPIDRVEGLKPEV
ncbi:MAG: P-II family nitrogen regulator [Acidobacteriota bacterium]